MTTAQDVKQEAVEVAESRWAQRLARFGHLARGVTFCLVGVLALEVAFGLGGKITDRQGALQTLADDPFGRAVLGALAVGLGGYALWCFAQALLGEKLETGEDVSVWKRIGSVGKGVIYSGLCIVCATLAMQADEPGGGGNKEEDRVTARILEQPAGRWLVAAIGIAIVGAGVFNFFRAVTQRFRKDLKEQQMGRTERRWYIATGVVGHFARATVFTLAGLFLLKAAYEYDPKEAIGLDGALAKVARAEYGTVLLVLVASGLFAYGLFSIVQARYRKV
jgi:Domain of Unknown Function (DUF1206)